MCDAYLTACLYKTCLNMKLSMNQYHYLGKDGHKLKLFYHAYGYYKNIAHKSNIYKSEKNNTTTGKCSSLPLLQC